MPKLLTSPLASADQLKLRAFTFEGLFGELSRHVELAASEPTIMTGANGTGKSTILRLINAVANGQVNILSTAPVERLNLEFDSGPDFQLTRHEGRTRVTWGDYSTEIHSTPQLEGQPQWVNAALEDYGWDTTALLADFIEIAKSNSAPFNEYREARDAIKKIDEPAFPRQANTWLDGLGHRFPVLFIADQRLITEPSENGENRKSISRFAIDAASRDIANKLRDADSSYARQSQIADSQLAESLIDRMSEGYDVPIDKIEALVDRVDAQRDALQAVGLLDEGSFHGVDVRADRITDPAVRRVVEVALESTLAKFYVLQDLEGRLSTFKQFLDGRLGPKQVELDRLQGMRFRLANGRTVRPRELSSGEQQITVLAYEILFRTLPSTLVMIDEPEISLHVSWQDSLIEDLTRMGYASDVQFLLATHSPMIVSGHPELERSLSRGRRGA